MLRLGLLQRVPNKVPPPYHLANVEDKVRLEPIHSNPGPFAGLRNPAPVRQVARVLEQRLVGVGDC